MTREEKVELINKLVDHYKSVDEVFTNIDKSVGVNPEKPLFDKVWRMFDSYLDAVALMCGDERDDIAWFIYEGDCDSSIKTVEDIVAVMEEGK